MTFGNTAPETGSNAGSDFVLGRFNDAGDVIDQPFSINRASGGVVIGTLVGGVHGFGVHKCGYGVQCRSGWNGNYSANLHNFFWDSANMLAYVDDVMLGALAYTSDYRIKKDVVELPTMLETVKALRPIKYTHTSWSPTPVPSNGPPPSQRPRRCSSTTT